MSNYFKRKTDSNNNNVRKGACFSVTMPFDVEHKLAAIQRSMGFNSRSQTIVYLVHQYDQTQRTFAMVDKLEATMAKMFELNKNANVSEQQSLPYNNK